MRCTSIVAGVLLAGSVLVAGPALAGTPWSDDCADEFTRPGGSQTAVLYSPLTVGAETGTRGPRYTQVCYATTSYGSTGTQVAGGRVEVEVGPSPGVDCGTDDDTVVRLDCTSRDPNPNSAGFTQSATVGVQSLAQTIPETGAEVGEPVGITCIRGTTAYVSGTTIGPFNNVGICP